MTSTYSMEMFMYVRSGKNRQGVGLDVVSCLLAGPRMQLRVLGMKIGLYSDVVVNTWTQVNVDSLHLATPLPLRTCPASYKQSSNIIDRGRESALFSVYL